VLLDELEIQGAAHLAHDWHRCARKLMINDISGADSMGHGGEGVGHVPPLLQMAGHEGTVSRRTANKKLTKLY